MYSWLARRAQACYVHSPEIAKAWEMHEVCLGMAEYWKRQAIEAADYASREVARDLGGNLEMEEVV